MNAYLDIETTGLFPSVHEITVVGLYLEESGQVTQLVGDSISSRRLLEALQRSTTIYTYNGTRFDLPFLRRRLGVDLETRFVHRDLMFDCWKRNLYGGLKAVETRLNMPRKTRGIDGLDAVRLWNRYQEYHDHEALRLLLDYNKEDVLNLRRLKEILSQAHTLP